MNVPKYTKTTFNLINTTRNSSYYSVYKKNVNHKRKKIKTNIKTNPKANNNRENNNIKNFNNNNSIATKNHTATLMRKHFSKKTVIKDT